MPKYFIKRAQASKASGRPQPLSRAAAVPRVGELDPDVMAVGRQVLGQLQQTFKVHAAQPNTPASGRVGEAVRQIARIRQRMVPGVDQRRVSAESGVRPVVSFGGVTVSNPNAEPEPEPEPELRGPQIALIATSIQCWADTSEIGSDEIMFGGFCTDPFGRVTPLESQLIGDDFDEGDVKHFARGLVLASTPILPRAPAWPATYSMTLTLVEADAEGADEKVAELWEGLQSHVQEQLQPVVSRQVHAAAAVALTTWVLDSFVGWMSEWSENDLIGVQMISLQLAGLDDAAFARAGLLSRRPFRLEFKGAGGHYTIDAYLTVIR